MFTAFKNLFDEDIRRLRSYRPLIDKINALESKYAKYSDAKLKKQTKEFKKQLKQGKKLDDILVPAFALVRQAIKRTIGERAYDVQLMAALTLHQGAIAEQKTGEGKTHAVIFPAYLNALTGLGVHIITPNDYLSQVGAGWYPKALHFLGLETACIIHDKSFFFDPDYTDPQESVDERLTHLRPVDRKEAYLADVTYGTNNEFGFDYLRDHMAPSLKKMVQRPHHYAIVDEVDFALIDEARTPLIISSPNNNPVDKYYKFAQIAQGLQPTDYVVDEKAKSATLSEYGIRKVEHVLSVKNLYEQSFETIHYIENAIKAQTMFIKDKDYVVKEDQVIIVDEFTGRLMEGRRWSDGLHQAVEAKEGVAVQQESQTWATITFQNYFKLYTKLAGMTGTALTEKEEFKKIYDLDVIPIPTNEPLARLDDNDLIYKTKAGKYAALVARVTEYYKTGQPVLIGTTSIENNQIVSSLLHKKNITHQLLNAKNHQSEAEIIARAGIKGAVTVATNMAGRGVDIILGGPKELIKDKKHWQKDHDAIIKLGGLVVLGTERHESRRIDNQLRGRSGRQGDPGYSQFYVSLEDDLMRVFGGDRISSLMTRFNMPENVPLTHAMVSRVLEQIQIKVEGYNFDIRKNLVEYDNVINKQRSIVYALRDQTLRNEKTHPLHTQKQIYSYLKKQIKSIILLNLDPDQTLDSQKTVLEFSEILPLVESARQQLTKDLAKADKPVNFLLDILKKQWRQRVAYFGQDIGDNILTYTIITSLDPLWVDHLTSLDNLRQSIGLQSYAQKDPLIEYRKAGYDMFQTLMSTFEYNLCRKLFRLEPATPQNITPQKATEERGKILAPKSAPITTPTNPLTPTSQTQPTGPIIKPVTSSASTPGRNDPCPCGSGKKYKKCCYPKFD